MSDVTSWGQLLLQGGAFGLLVYIVVRIYPQGVKDARDEREKRDSLYFGMVQMLQDKFHERNDTLVRSIEKQTDRLIEEMRFGQSDASEKLVPKVPKQGT